MNADISDKCSYFHKHMVRFCKDNNLILSSQELLPADSFSYCSEAHSSTSWLDHVICTADAHAMIGCMKILYEATTDHFPLEMTLETDRLPELTNESNNDFVAKIDWTRLSPEEVLSYCGRTDTFLNKVHIPTDAIVCHVKCKHAKHCNDLCVMYSSIVSALSEASRPLLSNPRRSF